MKIRSWGDARGFLVLDILIAGLILTSGIAATMYLFQTGYRHLERARTANTLSVKLIQVPALLRTLDLAKKKGTANMGDGVFCHWRAGLSDTADLTDPGKKKTPGPAISFCCIGLNARFSWKKHGGIVS